MKPKYVKCITATSGPALQLIDGSTGEVKPIRPKINVKLEVDYNELLKHIERTNPPHLPDDK